MSEVFGPVAFVVSSVSIRPHLLPKGSNVSRFQGVLFAEQDGLRHDPFWVIFRPYSSPAG